VHICVYVNTVTTHWAPPHMQSELGACIYMGEKEWIGGGDHEDNVEATMHVM
jgi:hypothetical protein